VETLVAKTFEAVKKYKAKNVAVGGGVAANEMLRQTMTARGNAENVKVNFVPRPLSADNGAMIALAALRKIMFAGKTDANKKIDPNMKVKSWS
ncbi:MAG: tRNA (adenosine(37)-N6)-threonylcarbamoyltransferase complex transferase subunit TsaD, partial [Elusimicrobium sp.]|jgi:N6-L-threonylcarbamoyladenine synthase|nr:tRNA (adenosine(37)-N6)-threonylcarbamoyltransferase complex transferase subunit TsaD [Elusimicrobium sp.]